MSVPNFTQPRLHANTHLYDTCLIYTITRPQNSDGETKTRTQRGVATPCRYAALSGRELERAQAIAAEADCVVTFAANTVINTTDELDITNSETGLTLTVQVEHVNKRSREIHRRVLCKDLHA